MRVHHVMPAVASPSIERIRTALRAFMPPEATESSYHDADLVILHVVGRAEQMRTASAGRPYVVCQYCVRSTQKSHTAGWCDLWEHARLVWSYLDLPRLCAADGVAAEFPFFHSPLGVNAAIFHDRGGTRDYAILTSGFGWTTESVREATLAARGLGHQTIHLGPYLGRREVGHYLTGVSDDEVAQAYSRCRYVSGLRRTEGFELVAAEGLLCGARPILFDQPHYRDWYGDDAHYIYEGDRARVIADVTEILRHVPPRVSHAALAEARLRFNWAAIAGTFWHRAL